MPTINLAPHLTAAHLNAILAKNASALTIQDLADLRDALNRCPAAQKAKPTETLQAIFP